MKDVPDKLDLISDEELIDAILARFDHAVFYGLRVETADGNEATRDWRGDEYVCRGLAMDMIRFINKDTDMYEEEE
jgi:hypothetical protein